VTIKENPDTCGTVLYFALNNCWVKCGSSAWSRCQVQNLALCGRMSLGLLPGAGCGSRGLPVLRTSFSGVGGVSDSKPASLAWPSDPVKRSDRCVFIVLRMQRLERLPWESWSQSLGFASPSPLGCGEAPV